jgi:hypothetical protein
MRLHKSSIIVGIVVSAILVLIMIPGRIVEGQPWMWQTYEHGWPFNYLRREARGNAPAPRYNTLYYGRLDYVAARPMLGIPWLCPDNWRVWEASIDETWSGKETPRWEFSGALLAWDLVISLLVLVGFVLMWEFRRGRRPNVFTFRIGDMLVGVAFVSAVLGWAVNLQREFHREEQVVDREFERSLTVNVTTDTWSDADQVCIAPTWMQSVIGERLLPAFVWRTCTIDIQLWDGSRAAAMAEEMSTLEYIRSIEFWTDSEEPFHFSVFRRLPRLTTMEFWIGEEFDASDISQLAQLRQLKKIVIDGRDEMVPPHLLTRLQSKLPDCKIIDSIDDW